MDAKFLERDAVCSWVMTHYFDELNDVTNIEAIIQWGKILYCTEAAYPNYPKEIILRYSAKDYAWAIENERPFWDYLVKQKLLLTSSEKTKQIYCVKLHLLLDFLKKDRIVWDSF